MKYYKEKLDSNHDLQILDDSKVHVTGNACEIWKGTQAVPHFYKAIIRLKELAKPS